MHEKCLNYVDRFFLSVKIFLPCALANAQTMKKIYKSWKVLTFNIIMSEKYELVGASSSSTLLTSKILAWLSKIVLKFLLLVAKTQFRQHSESENKTFRMKLI